MLGMQVHAKQGGMTLSSGSMLQPLRTGIFDLLKLRRRLEIHADSQVCLQKFSLSDPCYQKTHQQLYSRYCALLQLGSWAYAEAASPVP